MKNAWKGLVVGALTGMAGGAVMDMALGARRRTVEVAHSVVENAPSVAKAAISKAADLIHDADVPETVRDVAHAVTNSDSATKAKSVVKQAAASTGTAAG
jgi:hypothetical protein